MSDSSDVDERLSTLRRAIALFGSRHEAPAALLEEEEQLQKLLDNKKERLFGTAGRMADATLTPIAAMKAFIIMPFKRPFDVWYRDIIRPALTSINVDVIRSDEVFSPNAFLLTIWEQVVACDFVVAEMTGMNPNVMYELGLSHAVGKRVIMLTQETDHIPSDLQHINFIVYDISQTKWASKLTKALQKTVEFISKNNIEPILRPAASVENASLLERQEKEIKELRESLHALNKANDTTNAAAADASSRAARKIKEVSTDSLVYTTGDDDGFPVYGVAFGRPQIELDLVKVERGPFIFGSAGSAEPVELEEFFISRYSITNRQFCNFLNFSQARHSNVSQWIDLEGKSPADKCRIRHELGSGFVVEEDYDWFPATYVRFYGAEAFCNFLGGQLPTALEWEKAVRGQDGRNYPWGNEPPNPGLANIEPNGWARDVPPIDVRSKRSGRSPYGVVQAVGNVWHWTSTYYPERSVYAVRGGSFFDYRLGHPSVSRFIVQPNGPDFSQGFLLKYRFLPGVWSSEKQDKRKETT